MKIERRFTRKDAAAYADIEFGQTSSEIRNPDGTVVFSLENIEVPLAWTQVAADVLAQKYFRKAGIAAILKKDPEDGVPEFLWRSKPDLDALKKLPENQRFGGETSAFERTPHRIVQAARGLFRAASGR